MTIRTIYANPGDLLEIRLIDDPESPRTKRDWEEQLHPQKLKITISAYDRISYSNPMIKFAYTTPSGEIKRYLK